MSEIDTEPEAKNVPSVGPRETAPASGGKTAEIDGMDLAVIREGKLSRNEVYFDRMVLFGG